MTAEMEMKLKFKANYSMLNFALHENYTTQKEILKIIFIRSELKFLVQGRFRSHYYTAK